MSGPRADLRERLQRVEALVAEVEELEDAAAQARTREIVDAVLELHGAGLARLLEIAHAKGAGLAEELSGDELVASLLVLHGLHPLGLEARVARALEKVRTGLLLQGAEARLLAVEPEGTVRVELALSGQGCGGGARAAALLEDALARAAPEALVVIESGGPAPSPGRRLPILGAERPLG